MIITGTSGLVLHKMRPRETKTDGFCLKEFVYKIIGAAQTNPKRQMVWKAKSKRCLVASKFRERLHSLPDKLKSQEPFHSSWKPISSAPPSLVTLSKWNCGSGIRHVSFVPKIKGMHIFTEPQLLVLCETYIVLSKLLLDYILKLVILKTQFSHFCFLRYH